MTILSVYFVEIGAEGVIPRTAKIWTTATYAQITTPGYLNDAASQYEFETTDWCEITYAYNQSTAVGTNGLFQLSIATNGIITLVPVVSEGNVHLPVVVGNIPEFYNGVGVIADSGIAASNISLNSDNLVNLTNFPAARTNLGLGTAAVKNASDNTKTVVSSVSGTITSGHLAVFADINGTIQDGGAVPTASGNVNSGTINQIAVYAAAGTTVQGANQLLDATSNISIDKNSRQFRANNGTTIAVDYSLVAGTQFQGLQVKEVANGKQGVATLVAGTVTVANTSITANSRIFLTAQDNNTVGALRISARSVGVNFTITSSLNTDTGVVAFEIFEPTSTI